MIAAIGLLTTAEDLLAKILRFIFSSQKEPAADEDGQNSEAVKTEAVSQWQTVAPMLLVVGTSVGTSIGIFARTHNWLGDRSPVQAPYEHLSLFEKTPTGAKLREMVANEVIFWRMLEDGAGLEEIEVAIENKEGVENNSTDQIVRQLFNFYYVSQDGLLVGDSLQQNEPALAIADPGIGGLTGVEVEDCVRLRRDVRRDNEILASSVERLIDENPDVLDEDFADAYSTEPLILAGALLWYCSQDQ